MKRPTIQIYNFAFSFDFFPKIGGAHLWLYEVAKYWGSPIEVITSNFSELSSEQKVFDSNKHGSIKSIKRFPFKMTSMGIDKNFFINSFYLLSFFKKRISSKSNILVLSLRVVPETALVLFTKFLLRKNFKIVTYAHGEEFLIASTSRQLKLLGKLAIKYSDLIIANSFSTKRLVLSFYKKANVSVVYPGVDFKRYQITEQEKTIYRKKWGFPENTIILVTVARMEPRKNHPTVIKALAELRQEGLPLAYVIGGEGEEERNLRFLANNLGIKKWIKFLGRISEDEKIKTFCASDIHVMPSIKIGPMIEGFGIVFMEAAAAGIPSIAGNVGGQAEAVIHNKTGFVVDGQDIQELKRYIKKLVLHNERRKYMGLEARKWAKQHDWRVVAERIKNEIKRNFS